jgi:PPE-repeat protein
MALGIYAALPPEINVGRLLAGAGPGPMFAAAGGYTAIAQAAETLAAASDAQVHLLMTTWRGNAADRAILAFERHSLWLREVAALAQATAAQATAVANAYIAAVATSPTLAEIAANRVTLATLIATNILGINTIPIAVTEADYMRMWVQAAAAMYTYDAVATANTPLTALPPAPDITSPQLTGTSSSAPGTISSLVGPLSSLTGPLSSLTGPLASTASTATNNQLATDRQLDDQHERELLASAPAGFFGTVPASSVLAELRGGGASAAPISLLHGGFGAMPGTATGFRLPANWALAAPAAPGALAGEPAGTFGAPATNAPGATPMGAAPMGAVAPATAARPGPPETVSAADRSHEVPTFTTAAVIDVGGGDEEVAASAET